MRICQLSHVETTFNFLAPLFTALAEDGHEVVAASNMDRDGEVLTHYLGTGFEFHRIRVSRRITAQAFTTEVYRLARYLARERFDVVHLHGPLAAIQGRLAARLAAVPFVVNHAHGFYFHDGMGAGSRAVHVTAERLLTRHLTDYLVTVNEEDLDFARRHGFARETARLVRAPGVGIDTEVFSAAGRKVGRAVRHEFGVPEDELVVTFVGRLVAEKGVPELVTAFSGLLRDRPAWLWLVGDVSPSERDQDTLRHIDELQQHDPEAARRTVRCGQRRDIAAILAASDIVVQPSHREGMPVALLEAMACEVPVVTTDIRGCREAVDGGAAGVLVPTRDPERLTEALRKLAADPDERIRLGELARARVENTYAIRHSIAPVLAMYRRIEASRRAPRTGRGLLRTLARRTLPTAVRGSASRTPPWRISVQHLTDPLASHADRTRVVLSDETLEELGLTFVADPFAVHRDGLWHLFFEQVRTGERRGEIGLATSPDLDDWTYRGVVLAEGFHLSYPHVVETRDGIFMLPEASASGSVRLYRAVGFPTRWELDEVLLEGAPYKDSTLLRHDDLFYLFTETSPHHTHDLLRLFVAEGIRGPWVEHPASPVVLGNPAVARPAGRVLRVGDHLVRMAQSCERHYGDGVRGRTIVHLDRAGYRESTADRIVIPPAGTGRAGGSGHHVDAHPVAGGWVRFVDGHR